MEQQLPLSECGSLQVAGCIASNLIIISLKVGRPSRSISQQDSIKEKLLLIIVCFSTISMVAESRDWWNKVLTFPVGNSLVYSGGVHSSGNQIFHDFPHFCMGWTRVSLAPTAKFYTTNCKNNLIRQYLQVQPNNLKSSYTSDVVVYVPWYKLSIAVHFAGTIPCFPW